METISEIIHPEAWTHITVVFRPMEDNLSEDVDKSSMFIRDKNVRYLQSARIRIAG